MASGSGSGFAEQELGVLFERVRLRDAGVVRVFQISRRSGLGLSLSVRVTFVFFRILKPNYPRNSAHAPGMRKLTCQPTVAMRRVSPVSECPY